MSNGQSLCLNRRMEIYNIENIPSELINYEEPEAKST